MTNWNKGFRVLRYLCDDGSYYAPSQFIILSGPHPYNDAVRGARAYLKEAKVPDDKALVIYNNDTGTSTLVYPTGAKAMPYFPWEKKSSWAAVRSGEPVLRLKVARDAINDLW